MIIVLFSLSKYSIESKEKSMEYFALNYFCCFHCKVSNYQLAIGGEKGKKRFCNGNSFICCEVYECKMTSLLVIFSKTSTLQSTHKLFSSDDWNFGAHEGNPIEISSTCTIFSACGIFLECLESDSK